MLIINSSNLPTTTMIITVIILIDSFKSVQCSFFDSFTHIFDLYDGVQCSLQIIEDYLLVYNQPICCIFWKFKQILGANANRKCEKPENFHKLFLNGETLRDYVDFSRLDCSKYPENSDDCNYLWHALIAIILLHIIFMLTLIIMVIVYYCKLRSLRLRLKKSTPSTSLKYANKDHNHNNRNDINNNCIELLITPSSSFSSSSSSTSSSSSSSSSSSLNNLKQYETSMTSISCIDFYNDDNSNNDCKQSNRLLSL